VSIAHPEQFSWPGHWIGTVGAPDGSDQPVAVLLCGTPSAVIASPAAPDLVGKAVDDLRFRQALLLVPYQPFQKPVADAARTVDGVVGLYISPVKTGPMQSLVTATAIAGRGLLGDRCAAKAGTFTPRSDRLRGYDLTLIESEVLDRVTLSDGSHLTAAESRRNVVTRGIDLNALVGREFTTGSVRAIGQRLCEPCVHLQTTGHNTGGHRVAGIVADCRSRLDRRREFSNSAPSAKSLVRRLLRRIGKGGKVAQESPVTVFEDARGPNVRELRQAQRRLPPAELEALIADYEAGGRVGELAKVYRLHRTTVARHVARAGKTRPVMTEAQIDEAVRLYQDGWTLHNLGQRLGVADHTIRRVLVERAVTIRPGGRRKTAAAA